MNDDVNDTNNHTDDPIDDYIDDHANNPEQNQTQNQTSQHLTAQQLMPAVEQVRSPAYQKVLAHFLRLAQPSRGMATSGRRLQVLFVLEQLYAESPENDLFKLKTPEKWLSFLVDVLGRYQASADKLLLAGIDDWYHGDRQRWQDAWQPRLEASLDQSLNAFVGYLEDNGLAHLAAFTKQVTLAYLRTHKQSLARVQLGDFVHAYPLAELPLAEIFALLPPLAETRQQMPLFATTSGQERHGAVRKLLASWQARLADPWFKVVTTWAAELDKALEGYHMVACLPAGLASFRHVHEVLDKHLGHDTSGCVFAVYYKLASDAKQRATKKGATQQGRVWSAPAHYGGSALEEFFDIYQSGDRELALVQLGLSASYPDTVAWLDACLDANDFVELGDGTNGPAWYEYIDEHANLIAALGRAFAEAVSQNLLTAPAKLVIESITGPVTKAGAKPVTELATQTTNQQPAPETVGLEPSSLPRVRPTAGEAGV